MNIEASIGIATVIISSCATMISLKNFRKDNEEKKTEEKLSLQRILDKLDFLTTKQDELKIDLKNDVERMEKEIQENKAEIKRLSNNLTIVETRLENFKNGGR